MSELTRDLEAFIARCKNALAPFGCSIDAEIEDGITLWFELFNENGLISRRVELRNASEGEKMLVRLTIACDFARDGGVAIVDNLEAVDGQRRNLTMSIMERAAREGGSVIAAAAYGMASAPDMEAINAITHPIHVEWMGAHQLETASV